MASGFCLALQYGKVQYQKCENILWPEKSEKICPSENYKLEKSTFKSKIFLIKRIFRLFPIYLLTFLSILPFNLTNIDFGVWMTSLFMLQTWMNWKSIGIGSQPFGTLNGLGDAWSMSTLFALYFTFPKLLLFCQRRSSKRLAKIIVISFFFQLLVGCGINYCVMGTSYKRLGFLWVHKWPGFRFPTFVMGVCGGLLCHRMQCGDEEAINSKSFTC